MPHLAVLDPGVRVPELDCFNRIAVHAPMPVTYHLPALHGMDSLHRRPDVAGVIILGSGASVHDDRPWQQAMNRWLEDRLGTVPMLGLCYGHQLLAHLLGAEVGLVHADGRKLCGTREVELKAGAFWPAQRLRMVVSHREHVRATPEGCDNLGATDDVPVEAFQHRRWPVWGFQAHPEATTAFTANNAIPFEGDPADLRAGHALVDAFVQHVARQIDAGKT